MGCFFACFRKREKKRKNVHIRVTASPPRCRFQERPALKNRAAAARLKNPVVENQAPASQFSEVISDQRKPDALHGRTGANLRWTQQLVAPAEVPTVQRPNDYVKIVKEVQKEPVSSEKKDPLQEMDELALEIAELTKTIGKEVEDFEKLGNEVKNLRSRGTIKKSSISKMQMVTEQNFQHSPSGMKRIVSSKQSVSTSIEKSIVSEAEYSIKEVTETTASQVKVSDKEDSPSKLQNNKADSNTLSARSGSSARSIGKVVRFDLAMEAPSTSFDSANTGDEESSYDSTSNRSISQESYTVEEEDEEESSVSVKSKSDSCSYTGGETTISDISHSGQSADFGSEDDSVSKSTSSSRVTENEDEAEELESNASKIETPALKRPSRYQNYKSSSDEEEYDSLSDTEDSFASNDSGARNETEDAEQFEVTSQNNQSPPLQKSSYSPLKPTDGKQPTWPKCAKAFENDFVNNSNARIRAQYVYPVLNPVENLSQWKALKKDSKTDAFGNTKEFYESNKAWVKQFEMTENQSKGEMYPKSSPTKKQRVEARSTITELPQECVDESSFRTSASPTKENTHPTKIKENIMEVKEESNRRRKLIPLSAEPVFKEPKAFALQHLTTSKAVSEDITSADAVYVDASLSQWLKPTDAIKNGDRELSSLKDSKENLPKTGQISTRQDVLESEVNRCWSNLQSQKQQATMMENSVASRSTSAPKADCIPILEASGLQTPPGATSNRTSPLRSPSKNNDERPILGALSIENLRAAAANQISPRRSPTSKDLDDRPILGVVAAHWNDKQPVSPSKWSDGKGGIANSTNKYKEDQKVSWDSTPFEVRLERALSDRMENERHARIIS